MKKIEQSNKEKAALLDQTRWATDWDYKWIESFCGYLEVFEVSPGDVIFEEGASSLFMMVVVSGAVEILKENSEEELMVIANIGPGQTVGEMSLLDGSSRSASAHANENSTLLILSRQKFDVMCGDSPILGLKVMRKIALLLSQRLRWTSGQLVEYG